ncbi:MAG: hypothetical protein WBF79_01395 [Rhodococcus sp. (in: high G+C Gram-positive bacteria)]
MTIQDVNDVAAGVYELVAVQWDEITSKPGEPFDYKRHRRGDRVTLDVEEAKRLWLAGAIVEPGAVERAAADAARQAYAVALANLSPEDREAVLATQAGVIVDGASQTGEPARPPARANKAAWVDYAVARGMDKAEAEALKLPDLKAAFPDPDDVPHEGDGDNSDEGDAGAEDNTEGTPDGASAVTTGDTDLPPLPLKTADESEWIAAAELRGYTRETAEVYSKQELIELLS